MDISSILKGKRDEELLEDIRLGRSAYQDGVFAQYLKEAEDRGLEIGELVNENSFEKQRSQFLRFDWNTFLSGISPQKSWINIGRFDLVVNIVFYLLVTPVIWTELFMALGTGVTGERILVRQILEIVEPIFLLVWMASHLKNMDAVFDWISFYNEISNNRFGINQLEYRFMLRIPIVQLFALAHLNIVMLPRLRSGSSRRGKFVEVLKTISIYFSAIVFSGIICMLLFKRFDDETRKNLTKFST